MAKKCISLIIFLIFSVTISIFAQSPEIRNLALNQTSESKIKGGETHFYTVRIAANQTARIEIVQTGVDVALKAFKPSGEKFIETDSPAGMNGKDWILVTASMRANIKSLSSRLMKKPTREIMLIKLTEIRPTVAEDFRINEAALKIRKLAEQAETLRAQTERATSGGKRSTLTRKSSSFRKLKKTKSGKSSRSSKAATFCGNSANCKSRSN